MTKSSAEHRVRFYLVNARHELVPGSSAKAKFRAGCSACAISTLPRASTNFGAGNLSRLALADSFVCVTSCSMVTVTIVLRKPIPAVFDTGKGRRETCSAMRCWRLVSDQRFRAGQFYKGYDKRLFLNLYNGCTSVLFCYEGDTSNNHRIHSTQSKIVH